MADHARDDRCRYTEDSRRCKEPPVGELRGAGYTSSNDGIPWGMCERHIQPEMHPLDIRKLLHRWENRRNDG